jgi:hypothetical protein
MGIRSMHRQWFLEMQVVAPEQQHEPQYAKVDDRENLESNNA